MNFLYLLAIQFGQYRPRAGDYETFSGERGNFFNQLFGVRQAGRAQPAPGGRFQPASGGCGGDLPNPLGVCDLLEFAQKIINVLQLVAVPIVAIMVLYGAFQIITSGGQSERARAGGKTILYAAVGFGILLLADGIIAILQSILG